MRSSSEDYSNDDSFSYPFHSNFSEYKNFQLYLSPGPAQEVNLHQENNALVSPTNTKLIGKSGIAKVIQKKAGKELTTQLKKKGDCSITENVITPAYNMEGFKNIIHVATPNFRYSETGFTNKKSASEGKKGDYASTDPQQVLAQTYYNLLTTAQLQNIKNISCPILSGGKFRGNLTPKTIACMTLEALHQADKKLTQDGSRKSPIAIYLCTYEKSGLDYFRHLKEYQKCLQEKTVGTQINTDREQSSYRVSYVPLQDIQKNVSYSNPYKQKKEDLEHRDTPEQKIATCLQEKYRLLYSHPKIAIELGALVIGFPEEKERDAFLSVLSEEKSLKENIFSFHRVMPKSSAKDLLSDAIDFSRTDTVQLIHRTYYTNEKWHTIFIPPKNFGDFLVNELDFNKDNNKLAPELANFPHLIRDIGILQRKILKDIHNKTNKFTTVTHKRNHHGIPYKRSFRCNQIITEGWRAEDITREMKERVRELSNLPMKEDAVHEKISHYLPDSIEQLTGITPQNNKKHQLKGKLRSITKKGYVRADHTYFTYDMKEALIFTTLEKAFPGLQKDLTATGHSGKNCSGAHPDSFVHRTRTSPSGFSSFSMGSEATFSDNNFSKKIFSNHGQEKPFQASFSQQPRDIAPEKEKIEIKQLVKETAQGHLTPPCDDDKKAWNDPNRVFYKSKAGNMHRTRHWYQALQQKAKEEKESEKKEKNKQYSLY